MPRAGNTMSQADMRVRYWGTERFSGSINPNLATNHAPRTNADVFLALTNTDAKYLLSVADNLANSVCDDNPHCPISFCLPSNFFPFGNLGELPLRNFFARGEWHQSTNFYGDNSDEYGLTLEGKIKLQDAINILLAMTTGSGADAVVQEANNRTSQANARVTLIETSLAQQKSVCESLRTEIKTLEKMCAEAGIERPTECLNCGEFKTNAEDFGTYDHQSRMGFSGVSSLANDHFITAEGVWAKCENPEEENGGSYKETEGMEGLADGDRAYFGNAWNSCSKQEGDEGICRNCSFAPLGMLTPKNTQATRSQVGDFLWHAPVCCFHQEGVQEHNCVMWNKNAILINKQLEEVKKYNMTPLQARNERTRAKFVLLPSMVRDTGDLCYRDVVIGGQGLDGNGDGFPNRIAWYSPTTAYPVPVQ